MSAKSRARPRGTTRTSTSTRGAQPTIAGGDFQGSDPLSRTKS
jgi:hypothetical protein